MRRPMLLRGKICSWNSSAFACFIVYQITADGLREVERDYLLFDG